MPPLVRLYIRQVAIGFALAVVFVGLLMMFDVARLRSLILATEGGWLALFLLVFFNGIVFGGVQFAISIMRMAGRDDDDQGPGRRDALPLADPVPVPVRVQTR
jgi:hypothetical protein